MLGSGAVNDPMKQKAMTREESIRLEAYLLSEKAGHPSGMEQYFWTQAEALVQKRSTTAMPAAKKATRAAAPKAAAPKRRTTKIAEPELLSLPPKAVVKKLTAVDEAKPVTATKRPAPKKATTAAAAAK